MSERPAITAVALTGAVVLGIVAGLALSGTHRETDTTTARLEAALSAAKDGPRGRICRSCPDGLSMCLPFSGYGITSAVSSDVSLGLFRRQLPTCKELAEQMK